MIRTQSAGPSLGHVSESRLSCFASVKFYPQFTQLQTGDGKISLKSGPGTTTATATAQRDWHSTKPSTDLWARHRARQYITYGIRPLMLSPLRALQPRARHIKKPARPDFGIGAWHVG